MTITQLNSSIARIYSVELEFALFVIQFTAGDDGEQFGVLLDESPHLRVFLAPLAGR